MELVIITGSSGSGKSQTINAMEDIGFFCVDNLPPKLIFKFAEIGTAAKGNLERIAIVTDIRGGNLFSGLFEELALLKREDFHYKILFLDASDEVLLHRFQETRRKHPLLDGKNCLTISDAISKEKELLRPAREHADYILDTSFLSASQLKENIRKLFLEDVQDGMLIHCMSFGFKYGEPTSADLVFDVRCLPNPFYIEELKHKTGLDQPVRDYVLSFSETEQLLEKLKDLIDFLIPLYLNEGKSQLTIAFGCTGGKHRSVTFAELFYHHLLEKGNRVSVNHRDIEKK